MLAITTWLWGDKYTPEDVRRLRRAVARNLDQPHAFVVITDRVEEFSEDGPWESDGIGTCRLSIPESDLPLTKIKGCFARLRLFDPLFQESVNIAAGGRIRRIANMDLDSVVTGKLDPLFNRPERFMILQGANALNPCPFNGSLMMLRVGAHPEVWSDFSLEKAKAVPFYEFPDDQGWLWHKLPNANGWKVGSPSGVYAFMKPGWPTKVVEDICTGRKGRAPDDLPEDARLVVFPGWRSPEKFKHLPWIREHWQ